MDEFARIDLGKEELSYHVMDQARLCGGNAAGGRHCAGGLDLERVEVEAGPYGSWLVEGLRQGGLPDG